MFAAAVMLFRFATARRTMRSDRRNPAGAAGSPRGAIHLLLDLGLDRRTVGSSTTPESQEALTWSFLVRPSGFEPETCGSEKGGLDDQGMDVKSLFRYPFV